MRMSLSAILKMRCRWHLITGAKCPWFLAMYQQFWNLMTRLYFFLFCRYLTSLNERHRDNWEECAWPQPLASTEYTTPLSGTFLHLPPYRSQQRSVIWLAPSTGKMSKIPHCDWIHERARGRYLARFALTTVSRNKIVLFFSNMYKKKSFIN